MARDHHDRCGKCSDSIKIRMQQHRFLGEKDISQHPAADPGRHTQKRVHNSRFSSNNALSTVGFGVTGDKPVVGDFDGDGQSEIALFRPSNNIWYILKTGFGFFVQTWGEAGDIPVPADYDGDGKTDVAVFRPSTGQWFRIRTTAGFDTVVWGQPGDKPVPADYDGDGKSDAATFRPVNANWYIRGSAAGQSIQAFGQPGDLPTQASFVY